ncbi:cell surface hyaluronidase-like isoform X2 [Protopterus annectens]|uniref:cell surface hyaluronidase-like isoform X2 n=1 Tax=Protopterus annectens TaxID=7888 RepID=UPI001CFA36B7|nr:cell surface hyaluronidase-like isoform X2 [Protopterus annectens]
MSNKYNYWSQNLLSACFAPLPETSHVYTQDSPRCHQHFQGVHSGQQLHCFISRCGLWITKKNCSFRLNCSAHAVVCVTLMLCLLCWQTSSAVDLKNDVQHTNTTVWAKAARSVLFQDMWSKGTIVHHRMNRTIRNSPVGYSRRRILLRRQSEKLRKYSYSQKPIQMQKTCQPLLILSRHVLTEAFGKDTALKVLPSTTCDQPATVYHVKINPLKLIQVKVKPILLHKVLMFLKDLGLLADTHQAKSFLLVKKQMMKTQRIQLSKADGKPYDACPVKNSHLIPWNPGHDRNKKIIISGGASLRLDSNATVHSIVIENKGKLVLGDNPGNTIFLRTRYILIRDGGGLYAGSETCPFNSTAVISLYGKSTTGPSVDNFGKKFIGIDKGGILELHGRKPVSWTLLDRTLYPNGLQYGSYKYQKYWGSRGINIRIIDGGTGQIVASDRFDTHLMINESRRLVDFLRSHPPGRLAAVAVGDSAAKSLTMEARQYIKEMLGSKYINSLGYRQPWALVGTIGGGLFSTTEDKRLYEGNGTTNLAVARRDFHTYDGTHFTVTAYSEWVKGIPHIGFIVEVSQGIILTLLDDVSSWSPSNRIVIAGTDFSMYQAEEFTLLPCQECKINQVKIDGNPLYLHMGEIVDGVDMRAEVGLLTRNIVIKGEVEDHCYGDNHCQFFKYDTFGGQIKIQRNFHSVHLSGIELVNMGQQVMGSYPVHFHLAGDVDQKGNYDPPTYLNDLAIHHCFSRCIAVHGTHGLLVKDTIGYDTLGHCFFLEDGVEQRNTFYHNLGLLTKPGTILPTDRNEAMCLSIRDNVYGNYIPVPSTDCMAVSTFWIANPNNNLISNAAAGAQDVGFWYIFHKVPTGHCEGEYEEGHAEFTPLGIFYNNRAHSNFKAGLFIGNGVKTTRANAENPREYLALDVARFRPHKDGDPAKPRIPAIIDGLIAFKNNDHGAWARGGDIIFRSSGFADNGIGLTLASDGTFPTDDGSSLEVTESIFVGESSNVGCHKGQNIYWGRGANGEYRTLPRNKTFPIRGFQIYDGPVRLTKSTFKKFMPTADRFSSAIGFFVKNSWQISPKNNVTHLKMEDVDLKVFFGKPGQWFGNNNNDGDKTCIFHDLDGSVTGYRDTYVARADNYLIQHPGCIRVPRWNGIICAGKYAQLYIQARRPENLTLIIARESYARYPLKLHGVNRGAPYQQYQPVVMLEQAYTLNWDGSAPEEIILYPINFNRDDWIHLALCYPKGTTFKIVSDVNNRQTGKVHSVEHYTLAPSLQFLLENTQKALLL